jgi:hypothetical protein
MKTLPVISIESYHNISIEFLALARDAKTESGGSLTGFGDIVTMESPTNELIEMNESGDGSNEFEALKLWELGTSVRHRMSGSFNFWKRIESRKEISSE